MTGSRKPTLTHFRGPALAVAACLVVGSVALAACGADPYKINWVVSPDTVVLYSLAHPNLNLVSAMDFYNRQRLRVEDPAASGNWDVAIDTRAGKMVLVAPGALGMVSKARIVRIEGVNFDDVVMAPADTTLYTEKQPLPLVMGSVYVVRSRKQLGGYGTTCVYYAKMAPVEIDSEAGSIRFVFDSSPVCNDRNLVPTD